MRNYTFSPINDNILLKANKLVYSGRSKDLNVVSLYINSVHNKDANCNDIEESHFGYQLEFPQVSVSGLDLAELLQPGALNINKINIENPAFDFIEHEGTEPDWQDSAGVNEWSPAFLTGVSIDELNLIDGSLKYFSGAHNNKPIHKGENIVLTIHSLQIDSTIVQDPYKGLSAENIFFQIHDYSFSQPKNPHQLSLNSLSYSSTEKALTVDSIHLRADWELNRTLIASGEALPSLFTASVPKIKINQIDLAKIVESNSLSLGSLEMENLRVMLLQEKKAAKLPGNQTKYGSELMDVLNQAIVGSVAINDASFLQFSRDDKLKKVQEIKKLSITTCEIEFGADFFTQEQKTFPPIEKLNFHAKNYKGHFPENDLKINVSFLQYDSEKEELFAHGLDIRQGNALDSLTEYFTIAAESMALTGLGVADALNSGELLTAKLKLSQPDIEVQVDRRKRNDEQNDGSQSNSFFNIINPLAIDNIEATGSNIKFQEIHKNDLHIHQFDNVNAHIGGLLFTPESISNTDERIPIEAISITSDGYSFRHSNGIHSILLDSLLFSGNKGLTAARIEIKADREANERLKKINIHEASHSLYNISSEKFQISGLDLLHAYKSGGFIMEEIQISDPEIDITHDQNVPLSFAPQDEGGLIEQIDDVIDILKVNRLVINDGKFRLNILKDTLQKLHDIDRVSLIIDQLGIASMDANDPLDIFEVEDINLSINSYYFLTPDSLYELEAGNINASLKNEQLTIENLRLSPLFEKEESENVFEYVKDRYEVKTPSITFSKIGLRELFDSQELIAENLVLNEMEIEVFRDNRMEMDPERRTHTLQHLLLNAGTSIKIDTAKIEAKIAYSEIPANGSQPIELLFENTEIEFYNVTNDSSRITENPLAIAQAVSQFMGKSTLSVDFTFHLDHPENLYTYQGSLDAMEFEVFNSLFENMIVRIKSGEIYKVDFSAYATDEIAKGEMDFHYNNLLIKLQRRKDSSRPGIFYKAGTWLANNFLIKSNNPTKRGRFRTGTIYVERDKQRSVFHHMGGAMKDGVLSSLMPPTVEFIIDIIVGN